MLSKSCRFAVAPWQEAACDIEAAGRGARFTLHRVDADGVPSRVVYEIVADGVARPSGLPGFPGSLRAVLVGARNLLVEAVEPSGLQSRVEREVSRDGARLTAHHVRRDGRVDVVVYERV